MNPVIDMLKHAMQAERDGFHHYRAAAEHTDDPKAKEVFEKLAQDELAHHKLLEETLASVEKGASPPPFSDADRGTWGSLSGPSPIFSEDFKARIKNKHAEMSALSIGMVLEQNGIAFYSGMEKKAEDPELKKMMAFLVKWEKSHLEALSAQAKFFHESYMQDAHFAPF
jgi:rubrerythrin